MARTRLLISSLAIALASCNTLQTPTPDDHDDAPIQFTPPNSSPRIEIATMDGQFIAGEQHLVTALCKAVDPDGSLVSVGVDLSGLGGSYTLLRRGSDPTFWGWSGMLTLPASDTDRNVSIQFSASDNSGATTTRFVSAILRGRSQITPQSVLHHPKVLEAFRDFFGQIDFVPYELGNAPPNVVGSYSTRGSQVYPFFQELPPGTLQWNNQTSDNRIQTAISGGLAGIPGATFSSIATEGEIIRGDGNAFTVYTIQNVTIQYPGGSCTIRNSLILTGVRVASGHIAGTYAQVPLSSSSAACVPFATSGVFQLTPSGMPDVSATSTTDVIFSDVLASHGYDVFPWSQHPISADEFANFGVSLYGIIPDIYDYLRASTLGASVPGIGVPLPGSVIESQFRHWGGDIDNPWIFNISPPAQSVELRIFDGNGNPSTHKLIACSEMNGGGIVVDIDAIDDSQISDPFTSTPLRVQSPVPIKSLWLTAYPYPRTTAERIIIGR